MFRSVVKTAAGNLKLNRRSLIPNDAVSHFPAATTLISPSLDRSFSSSKSTKSTLTKTKKSEGKKSKSKGGESGAAAGAEDGEFGGSAGDDLEAGRAKRLADDEKIPSLDVGPKGRPLFTPRDVTLSKLSHKDINSYFKFDEAALKAVLPEGLASGIEDEFKESWRPALLVRKSFLDLRDNFRRIADPPMWPSEGKGGVKPKKQIILDGPVKSGKSIALAMLVHWARDEGWLVLYAPKGRDWTHGGYFYKNQHTGFWDTPLQAESILKDFVKFNEPRLKELRCNVFDPIVLGEGAGVGYLKGQDTMPIPEDSTLYDLVQMGIKSTHAAVSVVVRLRKELSLVKDVPVLIAIDQYNNWFTFSEFEEPVTPRSCRPIHARELTTVNAFRSMMHDDMMVGAFSHSTAVGKLRKDLPDVPADARQNFPRYSLDEAEAVCYYYLRQRLVRREVFSDENWKKIYYLANGNGAEMRWLVPFMR
ncbi:Mitochondrial 28S ribosomal protein S29-like protein [Hirschfeldia incana]|nr:Mitochondrial 28S ribosomal protein S29-like protein [Hirschfeldia incana]